MEYLKYLPLLCILVGASSIVVQIVRQSVGQGLVYGAYYIGVGLMVLGIALHLSSAT